MNEYTFHFLRPPNYKTDVTYYLPKYLKSSAVYSDIQQALSIEHERYRLKIIELAKQFKPQTATFGLKDWQDELGININDDVDIEIRRSKVLAKLLGTATMTVENTNRLINLFTDDNSGYVRELPYPGTIQIVIPTAIVQLADLRESLYEMMPAHLAIYFTFTTPDLIDEIIKTSDNHFLTINNAFSEFVPFGVLTPSNYGEIFYPFNYHGFQDFNSDQLMIKVSLSFVDRYQIITQYGIFKAGDLFGELINLPADRLIVVDIQPVFSDHFAPPVDSQTLSLNNAFFDHVPLGAHSFSNNLILPFSFGDSFDLSLMSTVSFNLNDYYKIITQYGIFKAGDLFGELINLPQDHFPLFNINHSFKENLEVNDFNGKICLTQFNLYGKICYNDFVYGNNYYFDDTLDGNSSFTFTKFGNFNYGEAFYDESRHFYN